MANVKGEGSLYFGTGIDNSGLKAGSSEAVGIVQGMAKNISKINPFTALAVGAIASFSLISKSAYQMAKGFETAMAEVKTISDATQENYADISKSVFQLSKISTDKPVQLAEAYYQIVSAGFDGAKGLKLLEVATKSAVGGITDTKTSADGLTTVINAFKLEAEEAEQVADVLFQTVKLGKTTFSELASNMSTVAPIASASGVSFEQVAGAIATLTKQGVPTAQAMTQIRSAIIGTNEALGDGWAEAMTLQEAFQLLYEKANGSQTELQGLVGRIEAVSGVLGIAGKNAKGATADLEAMGNVAGASGRAFDTMIGTAENQWKLFSNNIKGTIKGLGDAILVISSGLAGFFNKAFEEGDKLERSYREQRVELFKLQGALLSVNEESEERKELIEEIIKTYPNYLSGIDSEKVSNESLLTVLDQINEAYKNRYKLEKRERELRDAVETEADIDIKIEDSRAVFRATLAQLQVIADDEEIDLKIDYSGSDVEILQSIKEQLKDVDGAMTTVVNTGDKFDRNIDGWATKAIDGLSAQVSAQFRLNAELKEAGEITDDLTKKNDFLTKQHWNNAQNQVEAIELIKKATKSSDLLQFNESTVKAVQDALNVRKKTVEEIEAINKISREEFKKNPRVFAEFLASENEEIKELAKARQKAFSFKIVGGKTDIEEFKKGLSKQKDHYTAYLLALENEDEEFANKIKEKYGLTETNYVNHLRNLYNEAVSHEEKMILLGELKKEDAKLPKEQKKIEAIPIGITPILLADDYVKSVETLNKELSILNERYRLSESKKQREHIGKLIEDKKKEVDIANGVVETKKQLDSGLYNDLRDNSRKFLKTELDRLKKKLKAEYGLELANAKKIAKLKGEDEAFAVLMGQIDTVGEALGGKTQETINQVAGGLRDAGALFAKFGEEDVAELLGQLAGVAEGVGQIMTGDVVGGSLAILNSAITVEIDSDTAKFEKEIDRLSIVLNRLSRDVADAYGLDKIDTRLDALKEESALMEANKNALQAELEARKKVKFLGITVGNKGRGSGTDAEKVKEFEDAIDELEHKLRNLKLEIYETLTATTSDSITDAIIQGFKDGKTSIEDFAGTFEDLMKDAIIESFKLRYLENVTQDFFEQFGALAQSDNILTPEEIEELRHTFSNLIANSESELSALNDILLGAGIDGGLFGVDKEGKDGLSGAIRREITEETGTELAGLMRRIAEDVNSGLIAGRESLENLILIQQNTFNTVTELQNAVVELKLIADNTKESLLHDLAT